jgi:hypothetical protein
LVLNPSKRKTLGKTDLLSRQQSLLLPGIFSVRNTHSFNKTLKRGEEINRGSLAPYRPLKTMCARFLSTPKLFRQFISFLDFRSLFRLMQTRRDYRWDIKGKGQY